MNSIKRPRRRPRVRSVSFHTFGWLLVREAYMRVFFPETAEQPRTFLRAVVAQTRTDRLAERLNGALAVAEDRSYYQ